MEPMIVDAIGLEENDNSAVNSLREVTVDRTNLDLDGYISLYTGYAKYQRLLYVAEHCPSLRIESYQLILNYLRNESYDVHAYMDCFKKLSHFLQTLTENLTDDIVVPSMDSQWCEITKRKSQVTLEKLDMDLKSFKQSGIKESTRRGQDDLAAHYLKMGDVSNALKNFSRTRDYCTNPLQELEMCLNVIRVSIYSSNWLHARSHITKAETCSGCEAGVSTRSSLSADVVAGTTKARDRESILQKMAFVQTAAGLVELADGRYRNCARYLLNVQFDFFNFPDLLSIPNAATYAGLCALATFDRAEIKKLVISNANFSQFLEVEPIIRDIVTSFYNAHYDRCLEKMEYVRSSLLLDLYLGKHVEPLFMEIRKRALSQYFSPYVSADLNKMAVTFSTSVPALEDELMKLIMENRIAARIDSNRRLLVAKQADLRCSVFESVLQSCTEWERRNGAALLHLAVARANLSVSEGNPLSSADDIPDLDLSRV